MDALPEGHYFDYEDRELPSDISIHFRPTRPFRAFRQPDQYRIHISDSQRLIKYKRREEPASELSAEIVLVLSSDRDVDVNAARFVTKAKESDFDHCREPGIDGSKITHQRVTQIEFPLDLTVYVEGLSITPIDLVFFLQNTTNLLYSFPIEDKVAQIVLLVHSSQSLPPG